MKPHPFDQITKGEIENAVKIIRENKQNFIPPNNNGQKMEWTFIAMINQEPPKKQLLPLLQSGGDLSNIPRKSLVILEQKGTPNAFEAIVNHDTGKMEKFVSTPGKKTILTLDNLVDARRAALEDPEVINLLKNKYNISDVKTATSAAWSFGYNGEGPDDAPYNDIKAVTLFFYFSKVVNDNIYAHPTGFAAIIDVVTKEVKKVIDIPTQKGFKVDSNTNFKIPNKSDNYLPEILRDDYYRKDMKPIVITQPEGPSFTIRDNFDIYWQKWNFRISFNYRSGLVFHYITYTCSHDHVPGKDGDEERGKDYTPPFIKKRHEILYQMGLSEMVVPYGDPRFPYIRKMPFDLGEYGLGFSANSLEMGCDCIGSVRYFDFHYVDGDGNVKTITKVVCLHEEDSGISHKHTEPRTGKVYVVRGRRLVVSFACTVGNYDYIYYWYFHHDGSISHEIKPTGILSIHLLAEGVNPQWGTKVFPLLNAQYHQHIFCMRLDFLVDGINNTAAMLDLVPLEGEYGSEGNPYGTGFAVKKTEFLKSKEAITDTDTKKSRVWIIQNESIMNEYSGTPIAWKLIPSTGAFSGLLAKDSSWIRKRAGFAKHAFWVTPYKEDELYAAGFYVNQCKPGEGLEYWANRNESIKDKDIVVWHTYGLNHVPRVEDFPIMAVESCGFMLKPYNFLYQMPALDVPPSEKCYTPGRRERRASKDEICSECWWGERRTLSQITCKHKAELLKRSN